MEVWCRTLLEGFLQSVKIILSVDNRHISHLHLRDKDSFCPIVTGTKYEKKQTNKTNSHHTSFQKHLGLGVCYVLSCLLAIHPCTLQHSA